MFNKKFLFAVFLLFASISGAMATKQRADYIEFQSRLYKFGFYGQTPLEDYFHVTKTKRPKLFTSKLSNFKRGHIGHWRVHNKKLWLVTIYVREEIFNYDPYQPLADLVCFPLERLFPGEDPIIYAKWYSGKLIAYADERANLINDREKGDNPLYSLTFEKGILVKSKRLEAKK